MTLTLFDPSDSDPIDLAIETNVVEESSVVEMAKATMAAFGRIDDLY